LVALKHSIESLPEIRALLNKLPSPFFERITSQWDDLADVACLVDDAISDDPPLTTREGGMIKPGFDEGLDELIGSSRDGKDWISGLEAKERQATGINTLKVRLQQGLWLLH
jgi:DNA mismatch repair protein MutS